MRPCLLMLCLGLPLIADSALRPHAAQAAQVAGLRDQLEKGLKARLPAEFAFLDRVVIMVERNELPRSLVDSSFLWVRKNKSHKNYLVPFFERVLRARAAQMGIRIP